MNAARKHGGWLAEFRRRRIFRTMVAYLVSAWLLMQVANVTFPPLGVPDWMQRVLIVALILGIVPAFALAWLYDFTAQGIVRTPARADATPAVGRAENDPDPPTARRTARSELPDAAPPPQADEAAPLEPAAIRPTDASIAILPFMDLSPAKDQDWFCDGLAEEIIDALCCVRRLRVASRTASFRFRDGSVDPREIARQLRVGAILEGSVRKAGEHVRITAQLVDAGSGYHLWSESWDRRLEDVFAIQGEIARKVSAALRVSLTGDEAARRERHAPRNAHAHEFYLRGRQLGGRVGCSDWMQALPMFRRAIELDPEYAQAYAGLADSLAQLVLWRFLRARDVLPEATHAAHRALELAPDLAEAHVALGHVRSLGGDNDGATRSFEHALRLNPELFDAHYYFARHCFAHGEFARAAQLFTQAFALRPDDFTVLGLAVQAFDAIGEHARADAAAREALAGLEHQLELDPRDVRGHYFLACLLARFGRPGDGVPHIEAALRLQPDDFGVLYNAACFYSKIDEPDRALDLLERAFGQAGGSRDWIDHDSDLDPLRANPRFQALLDRLGCSETVSAQP